MLMKSKQCCWPMWWPAALALKLQNLGSEIEQVRCHSGKVHPKMLPKLMSKRWKRSVLGHIACHIMTTQWRGLSLQLLWRHHAQGLGHQQAVQMQQMQLFGLKRLMFSSWPLATWLQKDPKMAFICESMSVTLSMCLQSLSCSNFCHHRSGNRWEWRNMMLMTVEKCLRIRLLSGAFSSRLESLLYASASARSCLLWTVGQTLGIFEWSTCKNPFLENRAHPKIRTTIVVFGLFHKWWFYSILSSHWL